MSWWHHQRTLCHPYYSGLVNMGDPMYSGDLFLEPGLTVKQEPPSMEPICSASASVPIPRRSHTGLGLGDLRDFDTEFPSQDSVSGSAFSDASNFLSPLSSSNPLWMDDEDIFKVVDKNDLIQGPTLAELNANEPSLWEGVEFDDLLIPDQESSMLEGVAQTKATSLSTNTPSIPMQVSSGIGLHGGIVGVGSSGQPLPFAPCSFPPGGMGYKFADPFLASSSVPSSPMDPFSYGAGGSYQATLSPASQHSSNSSLLPQSVGSPVTPPPISSSPLQHKQSTLHDLLMRRETLAGSPGERRQLGSQALAISEGSPGSNVSDYLRCSPNPSGRCRTGFSTAAAVAASASASVSRLSSSAPSHSGLDHVWQRREPRQHLLSTGSLAEAGSTSSLSTGGVVSPESYELSEFETDDSDHYEDVSSDGESSDGESGGGTSRRASVSKQERFFWQYNVQAKGPKGQRLVVKTQLEDPHHLNSVTDPVFSPQCSLQGIKHSGKARKGDGNDLTPNPRKLYTIGKELDKLSRSINEMPPVAEVPFNARPKTRKEKNKLASRACRLKKKAQHEANKIKLYGLENEHRRLLSGIQQVRQALVLKFRSNGTENQDLSARIDDLIKNATRITIAGETTGFVNTVLEKYKSGVPEGGLKDL